MGPVWSLLRKRLQLSSKQISQRPTEVRAISPPPVWLMTDCSADVYETYQRCTKTAEIFRNL